MLSFEYDVDEWEDHPAFDKVRFQKNAKKRMLEFALRWEELTKANLSGKVLNVRTGALRSSIGHEVVESNGRYTVRVFSSNVPYAAIHEYGGQTKPHDIFPSKAQALHFFMGSKEVFAKSVHHPGSKIPERSYIRSALIEALAEMGANADELYDLFDVKHGLEAATRAEVQSK